MTYTVQYYQDLVTSEHRASPKYMAWLGAMIEPLTVIQTVLSEMVQNVDVDTAVGVQLDAVGAWVGISRFLPTAITGVYFQYDTEGVGWDQAVWQGPFDPDSGLSRMPDNIYRLMIKFKILSNRWNGSIPQAYADIATVFSGSAYIFIVDNQDMSMSVGIVGIELGPLGIGILQQGYFPFKPEGVRIKEFIINPQGNELFAYDLQNEIFGGWDVGYWAETIIPT